MRDILMSDRYPSDWDSRRRRVYRRDNYTCSNCGVRGGGGHKSESVELHAHHIVPISKGGTHKTSNLKTLCASCHNSIHQKSAMAPTHRSQRDAGKAAVNLTTNQKVIGYTLIALLWLLVVGLNIFAFTGS